MLLRVMKITPSVWRWPERKRLTPRQQNSYLISKHLMTDLRAAFLCRQTTAQYELKEFTMQSFTIRDLREHTSELVRNAESGQYSVISKHGKPLFVALPFDDTLLHAGVNIALADKLVHSGELSVAAGAKLAAMPYAAYLQHLGSTGYSMLGDANLDDELASLEQVKTPI